MPEWLIERGIGETRCVLVDAGEIVETRVLLEGNVPAGTILPARLLSVRPAVAVANGVEYLLPAGAPGTSEGSAFVIEIVREKIPGGEAWKRPLAKLTTEAAPASAPEPLPRGRDLPFPAPVDLIEEAGWSDLLSEAREGVVGFAGGELRLSATPAMTLIDVDGYLPPPELAVKAAQEAARAIRRHAIGGSIGIDFPTVSGKAQRQAIAAALDALLPQPFERTAVNGFGFLQIVRPRRYPSLLELAADSASFEARALLRRAARARGSLCLVANPQVVALLQRKPEWLDTLARQVGGAISLRAAAELPMSGGYAEHA